MGGGAWPFLVGMPLTLLINQSFHEGSFPDLLKVALIKPIHKKGDTNIPENYMPIALLPSFSKVFEKAMFDRLCIFLEKYNILDEHQNGFRRTKSTTLAVYQYIQTALQHINEKSYGLGLLLDMSKVYESVDYSILQSKLLYGSGIRGPCFSWFKSYLHNRKQKIQIQNYDSKQSEIQSVVSQAKTITCSIPQGKVLGCVLFLICINDLPKIVKNNMIMPVLFADDISILIKCNNIDTANSILDETIRVQSINTWLKSHNLNIDFNKTKIIQFTSYNKSPLDTNVTYF